MAHALKRHEEAAPRGPNDVLICLLRTALAWAAKPRPSSEAQVAPEWASPHDCEFCAGARHSASAIESGALQAWSRQSTRRMASCA
eukprot:CAMPEP_0170317288 /NCGR_PEP_ID=MMETSP0116_2-20130129/59312_1 /TAXON_ID=400756 /ORGANISM="Durinskia baltica, Strain CSIRO CS-38" /LENGTH=85 /DNA_ID=CAMNT_0010569927 /DNA_START=11 /DNA_END=264 /DNA_ORIENTATION=-